MTKKGFDVLDALLNNNLGCLVSEVVIGRDKNIENDFEPEIAALCKQNGIRYFDRNEPFQITSDYSIAVSWKWLIPKSSSTLIILHDSLLPKYRGFAPLVNMLCNKEKEIGVTAIFASDQYDRGDIIAQSSSKINYPIKVSEAIDLNAKNYIALATKICSNLKSGVKITALPQDESQATYCLWRDEEDYFINWSKSSEDVLNFIYAVSSPYKGASSYINGHQKVRILDAALENDVKIENRDAGKVLFVKNKLPVIVCGAGLIILKKVIDDHTQEDLLPFKNFRIRLTNKKY